jgi:4'-phosphopantetheinyl transferase
MTVDDCLWHPPPTDLSLSEDKVHVWRASLTLPASRIQGLRRLLSQDEIDRAERFHFQRDREHFIAGRGLLRTILGRYLDQEPDRLRFSYSPHGKPALTPEFDGDTFHFNLSHSRGLALFALTRGRQVGIDLEHIRSDLSNEEIAERFFSPQEVATLRSLPLDRRQEAFFSCWTRKEAYIKARGEGLSIPLDQFDVTLTPNEPAVLLAVRGNEGEVRRWSLLALAPTPDYVAALAVEGKVWRLVCWQCPQ